MMDDDDGDGDGDDDDDDEKMPSTHQRDLHRRLLNAVRVW